MIKGLRLYALIGIAVVVILTLLWRWLFSGPPAPMMPPAAVISSATVTEEHWLPTLSSVGSLVAVNGIDLSTEVNGIVSEILFESGQPVKQNDVLVQLDASVDIAALEALQAEESLARIQFERLQGLFEKNVTSKSEYDEAEARFDAARARARQQEALINRKTIRAPFDGIAGIRQINTGQYITAGTPIVALLALNPIYVDYSLPERFLNQVATGQAVELRFDALPEQVFSGTISALDSGIDRGTRTLKIRATLENPDGILKPGMFAQVSSVTGEAETVLTIPRTAISFNTYGNFVYVINTDDAGQMTVARTLVETGATRAGRVQVLNLAADTEVVRTGLLKLRDGVAVRVDNQIALDDAELLRE